MTPDQTAALLAQILADKRVKAYGEARGWYATQCGHCYVVMGLKFLGGRCSLCGNGAFREVLVHPANRLDHIDNEGHLLALADAMNDGPITLEWLPLDKEHYTEVAGYGTTGPTRTLAVIAALGRALNIKEGNDNE